MTSSQSTQDTMLQVGGSAPLLALDIGGTKVAWAIVDTTTDPFTLLERGQIDTLAMEGGAAVCIRICDLATDLAKNHEVRGVAVASAGVVDPETGAIVSATNTMPTWGGTPLGDRLREATGLPVWILNDVHAHGLGEAHLGGGRGHRIVLSMAVGTGVGGALIVDGDVYFGERNIAGHFGHIHHHYGEGMLCSCGRTGHLETFCPGSGITNWYNQRRDPAMPAVANGRELQEWAESGNDLAIACFRESAFALGESLASLANSLDPSVIILSGSMTRAGDMWWSALREGYAAGAFDSLQHLPVLQGELGGDAPLLGATINYLRRTAGQ